MTTDHQHRDHIAAYNEFTRIAACDWVTTNTATDDELHAYKHITAVVDETTVEGTTWCGITSTLHIPGVFTRLGAQRCQTCCTRTRTPQGTGSPRNDPECPREQPRHPADQEPKTHKQETASSQKTSPCTG